MKSELERKNHSHTLVARECALICHVNQTLYSITLKWKHSPDKLVNLSRRTNPIEKAGIISRIGFWYHRLHIHIQTHAKNATQKKSMDVYTVHVCQIQYTHHLFLAFVITFIAVVVHPKRKQKNGGTKIRQILFTFFSSLLKCSLFGLNERTSLIRSNSVYSNASKLKCIFESVFTFWFRFIV